jgi:signal transduction histidine kinase
MRIARALRVLGYVLYLLAALPEALDATLPLSRRLAEWLCVYVLFGVAFHLGASARETDRRRRLVALAIMTPAMLSMAALLPCRFGSLTLVIVASQVALVLTPLQTAAWITLQTLGVGFFICASGDVEDGVGETIALLGFQSFAAVTVYLARRETEAKQALARANAELRATRSLLEETSRVAERARIAREIHDVLGHDLTALGLQLEVATHVTPDKAAPHVAKAQEVSARLLGNVREVVTAMRTPGPDLSSALRALVEGVAGLSVHLEMPDALAVDDAARAHCVLRCVQEMITNALRHAHAENLWIAIKQEGGAIAVEARDDGCGAEEVRAGGGLSGMRARLEEMGGWLRVVAEPSRAFVVSAWLPAKGATS